MMLYEIKKVLSSRGGKITVLIFACVIAVSCWLASMWVEWMNENGEWETDLAAARKLRAARQEWTGYLDEEKLAEVITELNRITSLPEYTSKDFRERDRIHQSLQAIAPIQKMVVFAYSPGYQEVDETVVDRLTPADAASFYDNRVRLLEEGIYGENQMLFDLLSERQKQYLISEYEKLETPFYYDYTAAWDQMLSNSFCLILFGSLVLGFLVAGIFSNEFKWKADAVFFSSCYGRSKATVSKILAGFVLVTVLYALGIGIYTLFSLCYIGFDGGNCPIQLSYWKSFYNLTYAESYLLIVAGGYVSNLFIAFLAMWVSAQTRSSVVAVTVPFCAIALPDMLKGTGVQWLDALVALLPDKLMQLSTVIQTLDTYDFGFAIVGRAFVLLMLYGTLTAALVPALYRTYQRKSWC